MKGLSAGLHGTGQSDEVLVTLDREGEPHNELLRDAPELAREYRAIERTRRDRLAKLAERREQAARARGERLIAADARLDEARRQHAADVAAAQDEFQAAADATRDEEAQLVAQLDAERAKINARAFKLAEKQAAERDRALDDVDDDTAG
jgi:hypothetical protein